jgi:hypothetical protein
MSNRKNQIYRTLSFQSLEERRLMSATPISKAALVKPAAILAPNITTSVSSKHVLSITGNAASDNLVISQTGPNEFTVTGTNGTTINKTHTSETFTGITGDVNITLTGGTSTNESLTIGTGAKVNFPANLNINMGNGSNTFSMTNAAVGKAMTLNGGSSHDYVFIAQTTIGTTSSGKTTTNDLSINLGGGNNGLVIENGVFVQRDLDINDSASSLDSVYIGEAGGQVSVGRNMALSTGAGNDYVNLSGVVVQDILHVSTGAGNDSLSLGVYGNHAVDPVYADQWFVDLGAGDDTLQLGQQNQGGMLGLNKTSFGSFDGGAGTHDAWHNNSGRQPAASFADFEINNP